MKICRKCKGILIKSFCHRCNSSQRDRNCERCGAPSYGLRGRKSGERGLCKRCSKNCN